MLSNGMGRSQCEAPYLPRVSSNRDCRPSDMSAIVRLAIYASFEFQPTLGQGELLRSLTVTVEQLLDRSARELRK